MFSGRSAIVLGAGASADFGLPLGIELFNLLVIKCNSFLDAHGSQRMREIPALRSDRHFHEFPIARMINHCAVRRVGPYTSPGGSPVHQREIETQVGQIRQLRDSIMRSTAETIDEFITLHPSVATLCTRLMCSLLFRSIYDFRDGRYERKKITARTQANGKRNWIHLLINLVRTNKLRGRAIGQKVSVVTFNYDAILRTVLDELFEAAERNVGPWQNYFEIFPVHGEFSKLPELPQDAIVMVDEWASRIRTVGTNNVPGLDEIVSAAVAQISAADFVYAAGFAFAPDNCALIGLSSRERVKAINYINYDGNPGLRDRVSRCARPNDTKDYSGKAGEAMTLARALELGLLGDLPA